MNIKTKWLWWVSNDAYYTLFKEDRERERGIRSQVSFFIIDSKKIPITNPTTVSL